MEYNDRLRLNVDEDISQTRYLTFLTDNQLFGLPTGVIVQITQMQDIIELPEQAHYVKGIINLRGQIIPVMDVRLRFGKVEAAFTERTCIIITQARENYFGLIVDEVDEVLDILPEQISPLPKISATMDSTQEYLSGIAQLKAAEGHKERVVLLINVSKILGETELSDLTRAAQYTEQSII